MISHFPCFTDTKHDLFEDRSEQRDPSLSDPSPIDHVLVGVTSTSIIVNQRVSRQHALVRADRAGMAFKSFIDNCFCSI